MVKHRRSSYYISMAVLLCFCAMYGCGSGGEALADSGPYAGETSGSSEATPEEKQDLLGRVSYIGSSYISIDVCLSGGVVEDYAVLDTSRLAPNGDTASIITGADTTYFRAENGALEGILREEISKGDLIASVYTEGDAHRIILLEPSGSGEEVPEEDPEPKGATAPGEEETV